MTQPRAYTEAEVRKLMLDHCRRLARSAAKNPGTTRLEACEIAIFSVLSMLDGETLQLPKFRLVVTPHPDDQQYCSKNGRNWFEPGMQLADDLHHEFFK